MKKFLRRFSLAILSLVAIIYGCQTAYYAAWEKLGKEKRHLLKDHVEDTRVEQEKASEEFKDVLTRIQTLYGFDGGKLEDFYEKLRDDYEACEERAETVHERVRTVEETASDLFEEWEDEIEEITNQKFKSQSRQSLRDAKDRYARLHRAMSKSAKRMHPVLKNLRDYVLYLKHNLNAQAIGALRQEMGDIEAEVESLLQDIRNSIDAAEDFLESFES
ncbi:MAG: DNA repair protein [Desulfobacteraceae bacterium 4572_88]|nr:MAG: DNA repair protein [Desulfobacteraceae bacterium 4572_88]